MNTRELLRADHLLLKAAFRTLLKNAGGATYASESITRTDPARLSRYGNPNETMFAPVDVIRDLEADLGEPIVTRVLADLAGYVLVEKKAPEVSVDLDNHLVAVGRELSDVVGEIVNAKRDSVLTAQERDAIIVQAREGQAVLANLEADLKRTATVVPLPAAK